MFAPTPEGKKQREEMEVSFRRPPFRVEKWGLVPYQLALNQQIDRVERVKKGQIPDSLIFCSHPPVVTLGRASQLEDIQGWEGETHEVSRGGRVTYHGPSQLVVYPIFSLERDSGEFLLSKDVHSYLRCLETCLVKSLKDFGLAAEVKTLSASSSSELKMTGVWVGEKKLASIGVSVRSWVTYHGLALNLDEDPLAFKGIKPCGFSQETMTSMEELMGQKVDRESLIASLEAQFRYYFS